MRIATIQVKVGYGRETDAGKVAELIEKLLGESCISAHVVRPYRATAREGRGSRGSGLSRPQTLRSGRGS